MSGFKILTLKDMALCTLSAINLAKREGLAVQDCNNLVPSAQDPIISVFWDSTQSLVPMISHINLVSSVQDNSSMLIW